MTHFFLLNLAAVPVLNWLLIRTFSGGRADMLSAARGIVRRYLGPAAAEQFLTDPRRQELGGELAEVTVMFADLGGFSTYAETRSPAEVVELLNRYFALTLPIIIEEAGTPIQLPGDAIMAVFGAPIPKADHAARACRASSRMHRAVEAARTGETDAPRFRIGINSGPALVGNIGSEEFRNFTAIGDTTNVAQRLQVHAEPGQTVIGPATAAALGSDMRLTPLAAGPREGPRATGTGVPAGLTQGATRSPYCSTVTAAIAPRMIAKRTDRLPPRSGTCP